VLGISQKTYLDTDGMPSVLLQAMKQEPPLDAKCRDKFLVQSVAVTADKEFTNISAIVSIPVLSCFSRENETLIRSSGSMLMKPKSRLSRKRRFELYISRQRHLHLELLLHP
jgi:hypothetical protein